MKKYITLTLAALILFSNFIFSQTPAQRQKDAEKAKLVNTRIDNNGYWKRMAALGLARLNPVTPVKPAVYTGSEIRAFSVLTEDSPDVPVTTSNTTQSENSIFVSPLDNNIALNSNNSTTNPVTSLYGSDALLTEDASLTWGGQYQGAGGSNSGDPVALIGLDGTYYIGAISNPGGQLVAVSTNQGGSYTSYTVSPNPGELADKNHLWIDNSPTSPYSNNLYDVWTDFGGPNDGSVVLSRSTNSGVNWSTRVNISSGSTNGFCQGANANTGPNGEVYVIWTIYDNWPQDESAIGMARSFDGGATFESASRIIEDIRGIRNSGVDKDMRNNAFPSMAVDISNGEYSGNIYVVWTNTGVPGINTGSDVDVYMIRSEDQGLTWSTPVKVNQDASGLGSKHYFPWITCDPENGILSVVFYDDRNVGGSQCEVYCANSTDAGATWEDFKVSDVAFTPSPIPGLADGYMGDYLGINARGGLVYPVWTDNRTGTTMTYCSPYETNPLSKPQNLIASVTFETGIADLQWNFIEAPLFTHFIIYREGDSVAMATDTIYSDQLPDYGVYNYQITARYSDGKESSATAGSVQWGDAQISVTPSDIEETILPDSSVVRMVTVSNIGQLEMNYNLSMFIPSGKNPDPKAYCYGSGNCDEYIGRVQFNEIDNLSLCTEYGDYTAMSTIVAVGNSYQMVITNGNAIYPDDQCGVWVDWNQNEIFDENEACPVSGSPGTGPYLATITPPAGAASGETRLRARITYYMTPTPCGTASYGEVEDYTVNVLSWIAANPTEGTVQAGETLEIAVTLNSEGLAIGAYNAELNVFSNDPDDPEIMVPITLNVAALALSVSTNDDEICQGVGVDVSSILFGSAGPVTYSWTSDPPGFTSSDANLTVTPDVTTTYICQVTDGINTATDEVMVRVHPLPALNLGEDQTICQGETVTLDGGAGYSSYLWSTGESTQTIVVSVSGEYSVVVTDEFGCANTDAFNLTVSGTPAKPAISSGPATVDNFMVPTSTYTCNSVAEATSYQWTISPVGAGTVNAAGTSAQITWTSGYTGTTQVTVSAMNSCFSSEVSDAFATTVYTSAGVNDIRPENQLVIYPNPTDGKITMKLPVQKAFTGDVTISDAGGAVVLSRKNFEIPVYGEVSFDLGQLPDGTYSVKLSSMSGIYFGKVIIK